MNLRNLFRSLLPPSRRELQALSVTHILLDIVPGEDGMGYEIYAESVGDVESKLSSMGERLEDLELENEHLKSENARQLKALTPVPIDPQAVPHAFLLERTRQHAEYWQEASDADDNTSGKRMCLYQALYGWKNAAYFYAGQTLAMEKAQAECVRVLLQASVALRQWMNSSLAEPSLSLAARDTEDALAAIEVLNTLLSKMEKSKPA